MARNRFQSAVLGLVLLTVAGFIVSFVMGLGSEGAVAGGPRSAGQAGAQAGAAEGSQPFATGGRLELLEPKPRTRVEVLNAAGTEGIAAAATEWLRDRGFDVVYYGNAPDFGRDSSVVLARTGDADAARAVASALGIAATRSAPDSTLLVDVSVLLGRDWPSARERPGPGWGARLRRLLRRVLDLGSGAT